MIDNNSPKLRVMAVEDNAIDLEFLKHKLFKLTMAYEMTSFTQAEDALFFLQKSLDDPQSNPLPQLFFLDLKLPGESGLELLKKIKSHPEFAKIPVIMMTVSDKIEDLVSTYKHGGTFFMRKPWDEKILQEVLAQLKIWNKI